MPTIFGVGATEAARSRRPNPARGVAAAGACCELWRIRSFRISGPRHPAAGPNILEGSPAPPRSLLPQKRQEPARYHAPAARPAPAERDDTIRTASARPVEDDIFTWHINLRPDDGPLSGAVFHLIATFPDDYPCSPPTIELMNELVHPNVFGSHICLDMLKREHATTPYAGWTSAYSVASILLQLQSFLFAENVPQDDGGVQANEYYGGRAARQQRKHARGRARRRRAGDARTARVAAPPLPARAPARRGGRRRARRDDVRHEAAAGAMLVEGAIFDVPPPRASATQPRRRGVPGVALVARRELVCFHTKRAPEEDVLGVGVSVEFHRDGALRDARACLDPLSWAAFARDYVRLGVWKERFELFLPLVIDARHAARAEPLFRRAVARVFARGGRSACAALPRGLEGASRRRTATRRPAVLLMNSMASCSCRRRPPAAAADAGGSALARLAVRISRDRRVGAGRAPRFLRFRPAPHRCGTTRSATRRPRGRRVRGRARAPRGSPNLGGLLVFTLAQGGRHRVWRRPQSPAQRALVRDERPELVCPRRQRPRPRRRRARRRARRRSPPVAARVFRHGGVGGLLMFQVHFLLGSAGRRRAKARGRARRVRSEARSAERRAARARARGLPRDRAVRRLAGVLPRGVDVPASAGSPSCCTTVRGREERLPRQGGARANEGSWRRGGRGGGGGGGPPSWERGARVAGDFGRSRGRR